MHRHLIKIFSHREKKKDSVGVVKFPPFFLPLFFPLSPEGKEGYLSPCLSFRGIFLDLSKRYKVSF